MTTPSDEKRRWPAALWVLVVAFCAFLIQVPPIMGIFTMFLLGPLWPGLLVKLFLFVLLYEVAGREVSRAWLVVPVLYVALYAAAITLVVVNYDAKTRFVAENDTAALGWSGALSGDIPLSDAIEIVRRYEVPEVESEGRILRFGTPEICGQEGVRILDTMRDGSCVLTIPGPTRLPAARISREVGPTQTLPAGVLALVATDPNGRRAVIHSAEVEMMSGFPMILAGCGLVSARPAWECGVQFLPTVETQVGFRTWSVTRYERLLGLERR